MINWKTRFKNKAFWITFVPAVALLIQAAASLFGYAIDLTDITGKVIALIDAVFAVLVCLGVVTDPTTIGFGDSQRALEYDEPAE